MRNRSGRCSFTPRKPSTRPARAPLADEEGYVVRAVVDVAAQMSDLIVAQRSYQMNLQVIRSGEEAYQSALRIGRQ